MTIVAYIVVIVLVQLCLTIGVLVVGYATALPLAWTPTSIRTAVAGFVGGAAGVALAVAFGYWVFRLLVGEGWYGAGVFAASTVPLLIPMWNDFDHARQVGQARGQMLDKVGETRDAATLDKLRDVSSTGHGGGVVGEVVGIVLAVAWFLTRA